MTLEMKTYRAVLDIVRRNLIAKGHRMDKCLEVREKMGSTCWIVESFESDF